MTTKMMKFSHGDGSRGIIIVVVVVVVVGVVVVVAAGLATKRPAMFNSSLTHQLAAVSGSSLAWL